MLTNHNIIENFVNNGLYALQRERRKIIPDTIMVNQKTTHKRIPGKPGEMIFKHIPRKAIIC